MNWLDKAPSRNLRTRGFNRCWTAGDETSLDKLIEENLYFSALNKLYFSAFPNDSFYWRQKGFKEKVTL